MRDLAEIECGLCGGTGEVEVRRADTCATDCVPCPECIHRDSLGKTAAAQSEIEVLRTKVDLFRRACEDLLDDRPIEQAFILRKQAEAVEAALLHIVTAPHPTTAQQAVEQCAQHLRQQADEAERGSKFDEH